MSTHEGKINIMVNKRKAKDNIAPVVIIIAGIPFFLSARDKDGSHNNVMPKLKSGAKEIASRWFDVLWFT